MKTVTIQKLRFFPGSHAGLSEPTATCTLELSAPPEDWPRVEATLPQRVLALWPREPLFSIGPGDLPLALLHEDIPSGFAPWVVALTVFIQRLARDAVGRGRVLDTEETEIQLALPWQRQHVLRDALNLALRWLLLWQGAPGANEERAGELRRTFNDWLERTQRSGLTADTQRFALAARQRGMPVNIANGILRIGWGQAAQSMDGTASSSTSMVAARIAQNKLATSKLLAEAGIPVPTARLVGRFEHALKYAEQLGWPVVVKPVSMDRGIAVTPAIRDAAGLAKAFKVAEKLSPGGVLIEKHVDGHDYRLLVIKGRLLVATRRIPGGVVGDGTHDVSQLIERVNSDPRRHNGKQSLLIRLVLDDEARGLLAEQGLRPDSIPGRGRVVRLRRVQNIGSGGTAVDVTDQVHPDNRRLAERAARLIGLNIAGVDFLCPDIRRSWREVGGAVCEVNFRPGFRVNWLGAPARDINGEVLDRLFEGRATRIPTAAITGTNGKSTTARMLHHIWMATGKTAGVCTTHELLVGDELISDRNLSGQPGGKMLLSDPLVEAAVIEMPRKGLIDFGHPCDRYEVAALLDLTDDHIGVDGIATLEQMARLKGEVLERATAAIIVNAENPLCLAAAERAGAARRILVAANAGVPALQEHLARNGEAVFAQTRDGTSWIILARGATHTPLMALKEIPATMDGLLRCNERNALFAVALAWAHGIAPETIRKAMSGFANTPKQNPGRYNFIEGFPFQVLLDYAHNPDGVSELCRVVSKLTVGGKKRVLNLSIGNRHRGHLDQAVPELARTFDGFVLGCDPSRVRQSADYAGDAPVETMLAASRDGLLAQGVAAGAIEVQADPAEALSRALERASAGDLLVLLGEPWSILPALSVHTAIDR